MKARETRILTGYAPGLIGRVVTMHADFYSRETGFGAPFESMIAGGMAEFVSRMAGPSDCIWRLEYDGKICGSVTIDCHGGTDRAHLRWFILDDAVRGGGHGNTLMKLAVNHCDDHGLPEIYLTTFAGLDAARHLYEKYGFHLTEESPGQTWGRKVTEQTFIRRTRG